MFLSNLRAIVAMYVCGMILSHGCICYSLRIIGKFIYIILSSCLKKTQHVAVNKNGENERKNLFLKTGKLWEAFFRKYNDAKPSEKL